MQLTAQNALQIPAVQTNTGAKTFDNDTLVPKDDTWHDVRAYVTGTALDRTATTDMTAKFQAACDDVNPTYGGVVVIPSGAFLVNTSATLTPVANSTIRGAGTLSTHLYTNHASRAPVTVSAANVRIERLCGRQAVTTTGGSFFAVSGAGAVLTDLNLSDIFGGFDISGAVPTLARIAIGCTTAFNTPAGSFGIKISSSNVLAGSISDVFIQALSGDYWAHGIWLTASTDVTFQRVNVIRCGNGLTIAPTSTTISYPKFQNCYFDDNHTYGAFINPTSTGVVNNITFASCYFSSNDVDGVRLTGVSAATSISGVHFVSCGFHNNGTTGTGNGLYAESLCQYVSLVDCRGGSNQQDGVRWAANLSHLAITGSAFGPVEGFSANAGYGVNLVAGTGDYIVVTNNDLQGNTTGAFFKGATGTHNNFYPNAGDGHGHSTQVLDIQTSAANSSASNNSEQTLYTFTVPANTMGANGVLRLRFFGIYYNASGGNDTLKVKVTFGATTVFESTTGPIATAGQSHDIVLDLDLFNIASTAVQRANGLFTLGSPQNAAAGVGDLATAASIPTVAIRGSGALDTTADQAFAVKLTCTTSHASIGVVLRKGTLELLR